MAATKAYELLRRSMLDEGVIGIGQCVLWSKQTMLALIPEPEGIRMQTLFYRDQIKRLPVQPRQGEVSDAEMRMGRMLVHAMIQPYAPEKYRDEYEEKASSPPSSARSRARRSSPPPSRRAM